MGCGYDRFCAGYGRFGDYMIGRAVDTSGCSGYMIGSAAVMIGCIGYMIGSAVVMVGITL
ncbi:hypothetical protein [Sporosarcina sp. FSL K6-1508]|uniref:hypothetical protein n=1 Tax=Sporosarcina sp. FSL K6-1508 TaxID=2921553 RepID=UPI0030F83395